MALWTGNRHIQNDSGKRGTLVERAEDRVREWGPTSSNGEGVS